MAITEDFSFPTTTDTPPRFIESPPLWHRTSSTPSRHEQPERKSKEGGTFLTEKPINNKQRKSFSYVERCAKAAAKEDDGGGEDEEEKMDMLWEDLNEEVSRSYGSGTEYSGMSNGKVAEFGRVKALKLSKSGGAVVSGKKSNVVLVYMKVLKKLFSLNSQRSIKKRTW